MVTGKVAHHSLHCLGLEPYSQMIFKWGLKTKGSATDRENNNVLDRAMQYTGVVGVELVDMLVSVNSKAEAITPHVLTQYMFGGDSLQNFIQDHQDHLEQLEDQLSDLTMMTEHVIWRQDLTLESYCWVLYQVEALNTQLLMQVMALEAT